MTYDYREKKFVVVLSSKLEIGVAFNVTAHLCLSVGYNASEHMGRQMLVDASNISHIGISKYPIIITKVKPSKLREYLHKAKSNEKLIVIDYPSNMYETGHDDELAESISKTDEEKMDYFGFVLFGNRSDVDEITGKFSLWV